MRYLNDYSDWRESRDKEIDLVEPVERIDWFLWSILLTPVLLLILIFMNEFVVDTYPENGTIEAYHFLEGEWVGPPSMDGGGPDLFSMSTYFRVDSYSVSARTEPGDLVTFLCFSCTSSSYKIGDSVTFLVSKRVVGRPKFSEMK
ncbi:hypothetical protein [Algoriphagus aquimarinus]|uniref:hypothetical protein n=1 Tax=Algoriphagus aquimarinus TaxID=237018 RepID=UPI0030D9C4A9|tara:strand:+ start:171265 stop:171699 length:435 start_codon:yes stop_codon:yes gene_type:complete